MTYHRSSAYDAILAAVDSVCWERIPEVTQIRPRGHRNLNFFPGQRGFSGADFPVGGVMMVANNFDNLNGWKDYCDDLEFISSSPTWRKIKTLIVPEMGHYKLRLDDIWFTNYCLGVMDQPSNTYRFPKRIQESLEFSRVFDECVAAMQPRLIVSLGGFAAECLGTDYANRRAIESRTIAQHPTRLLAAVK